ncbi:putative zinc-binding protein [Methanogenium marinum]|uniref:Zinc-binding protein n=1 Tax=Methanogenium marinum TaxID=348610 RepID=A0A9Q4KVR4_9EURY|nr:putative zinc-binding protein [Methanogenium marinum]MDE4908565.1 putative zinc-binding protein [Methanogenium marinum]
MDNAESPVVLVTCSGLSNTGKCTTRAAVMLRQRNPELVDYHISTAGAESLAVPEGLDPGSLQVIVIDGCEDFCGRKKAELCGLVPACHVVATDCGVVKSGMDEPLFRDIEVVCRAAEREIRR